jgi:hypothetical protein
MKTATEIWIKEIPVCKCGLKCIAPTAYIIEEHIKDEHIDEMRSEIDSFLKVAGFSSSMINDMMGDRIVLKRMMPEPIRDEDGTPICAYCAVKKGLVDRDILKEQW